jgi:CubicO group peptidase (beta-lactamase class C family)
MYRKLALCLAVLLILTSNAPAQAPSQSDAVAKLVTAEMEKQKIPGLALLVARDGKTIRAQGFGFANLEHRVRVLPQTIFQSGSVGKQFAATAVMMLVEEGKISLDDSITKYLDDAPAAWKPITVRQLLSHTSGFPDYPEDFDFRKDNKDAETQEKELLKLARSLPLAYEPGTQWKYCNLCYATVGIIIRKVSGKFYGDFLEERIFQPLGMINTSIISEADIIPNRAAGYRLVDGKLKNQEWVSPTANTTADGSLYLTILDLAKWDAALYGEKLAKRSTLEQMWTAVTLSDGKPNKEGYGLGWYGGNNQGRRVLRHGGQWQGFNTHIARYVDDKLTVVVLTNLAYPKLDPIVEGVAKQYLSAAKAGSSLDTKSKR